MNTRILGMCGIIASPMLLISSARFGFDTANSDRLNAVLGLVFLAGWACSLVGLSQLQAAGTGGARLLLGVLGVGLILAAVQQVQDLAFEGSRFNSRLYQVADAAWPLSVAFMLVIGGVVARPRVVWMASLGASAVRRRIAATLRRTSRCWPQGGGCRVWHLHNGGVGFARVGSTHISRAWRERMSRRMVSHSHTGPALSLNRWLYLCRPGQFWSAF